MIIKVNEEKCQNCGICLKECIHNQELGKTNHVDHSFLFCNQCLHCYAVCPNQAIEMGEGLSGIEITDNPVNYGDLLFLLQKRRSVRQFKDKPIEKSLIKKVLEAARYIPSGGNNQQVSISLLKDKEKMDFLRDEVTSYYFKINKISLNIVIRNLIKLFGSRKIKEGLKDKHFMEKIADMNKKFKIRDMVFYGAPLALIFYTDRLLPTAIEDAVLAAYNIVLCAENLGLGSCFLSLSQQALNSKKRCKKIVGIDKKDEIHAVVVMGYPVRKYKRTVYRDVKETKII